MGDFNLELLRDSLRACVCPSGTGEPAIPRISLQHYTAAFHEVARFFGFINYGFAFVASNLLASCHGLDSAMQADPPLLFVDEVLRHAMENKSTNCNYISCVTWMHRPLELIVLLMESLSNLEENVPLYDTARDCYAISLGRYHNFVVRQMTHLLFHTLPNSTELRERTMQYDESTAKQLMKEVSDAGRVVHEIVENLLTEITVGTPVL